MDYISALKGQVFKTTLILKNIFLNHNYITRKKLYEAVCMVQRIQENECIYC